MEGKFSFPIIHGIKSHPENNQIMNILLYTPKSIPKRNNNNTNNNNTHKAFCHSFPGLAW